MMFGNACPILHRCALNLTNALSPSPESQAGSRKWTFLNPLDRHRKPPGANVPDARIRGLNATAAQEYFPRTGPTDPSDTDIYLYGVGAAEAGVHQNAFDLGLDSPPGTKHGTHGQSARAEAKNLRTFVF